MTNSIEEIRENEVIFVIGSNTTENHPVIGAQMRQAKAKGAKLIVADPRKIDLANDADVFLQIKPGTNIALLNAMMNVIINEGLQDRLYIKDRTVDYEKLVDLVESYTPQRAAKICQVNPEDIIKAARIYGKAKNAGIYYAMGITQHKSGTYTVMSVSNLALLCGNIGIESAGVNPLRGQNNVQGACDMGALPNNLPGYQKVSDENAIEKFEKAWNVTGMSKEVGQTIPEIMDSARRGDTKLLYIMGENPMISDPDINHVKEALEKTEFLIVQDIFLTETAQMADIVLPASTFAEKDGTFTNTERKIQRVRKAINEVGNSKADWKILIDIMNKLGYKQEYTHPSQIMDEISRVTPQYGGINYSRIEQKGLQWPCLHKTHKGTKFLHEGQCARGKGLFIPQEYRESAELPDKDYPFMLTTGRILYHYHTRSMTGRVEGLNKKSNQSYIEVNTLDAKGLCVHNGDIVQVSSRRGTIETKVKVVSTISRGIVFMPFHFASGAANILTGTHLDEISKIPELKVSSVKIVKK